MRAVGVLVVCLGGCLFGGNNGPNAAPELLILSPASGTAVTDHAPIEIDIEIYDVAVDRIDVALAGAIQTGGVTITPTPTGDPCEPCTFRISWDGLAAAEGAQQISIHAYQREALRAVGTLELTFADIPEIIRVSPTPDEDLLGVGTVNYEIGVIERGEVTMSLAIDGLQATTLTSAECRSVTGCTLAYTWDTSAIAPGMHELHATITDNLGNVVEDTRTVRIDDLVKITSIQLANTTDGGALEIEVYVFDNVTNAFLGCAGRVAGLGSVDASDVRYAVDAELVSPQNMRLRGQALTAHAVRFEVWEDDDAPICPAAIDPAGNDLVGQSPAKTLTQWKQTPTITFGNVTELAIQIGRPLTR